MTLTMCVWVGVVPVVVSVWVGGWVGGLVWFLTSWVWGGCGSCNCQCVGGCGLDEPTAEETVEFSTIPSEASVLAAFVQKTTVDWWYTAAAAALVVMVIVQL